MVLETILNKLLMLTLTRTSQRGSSSQHYLSMLEPFLQRENRHAGDHGQGWGGAASGDHGQGWGGAASGDHGQGWGGAAFIFSTLRQHAATLPPTSSRPAQQRHEYACDLQRGCCCLLQASGPEAKQNREN